jgi:hypothetical protein
VYEPHGFVIQLDQDDGVEDGLEGGLDDALEDGLEGGLKDGTEDGPIDGPDGGPQNGQNDEVGVIQQLLLRERLLQIAGLTTIEKMEALIAKKYEPVLFSMESSSQRLKNLEIMKNNYISTI